jgi:hypothetical protein
MSGFAANRGFYRDGLLFSTLAIRVDRRGIDAGVVVQRTLCN